MSDQKFPLGIFPKVVNTKIGEITKLSIRKKQFIEYLQSLDENEEYLNLDILKRKNPTEKSTHYIVVDDWKPKSKESDVNNTPSTPTDNLSSNEEELLNF